ncbi:MAG: fibronectin type III-like domain-contianing protein, partial [Gemmataceae bacterium]|nr:fibronectin type III-like domain-contianing protein [Gemmataceae bacterium]
VSPSGKLPITFPRSLADLPPYEDYSMEGRTYRYMRAEPLFPFGFGLSYTQFDFREIVVLPGRARARVRVANTGPRAGEEVVQVYTRAVEPGCPAPRCQLAGFRRVALASGEEKEIEVALSSLAFRLVDESGRIFKHAGAWEVYAGGCSPLPRSQELGAPPPAKTTIKPALE